MEGSVTRRHRDDLPSPEKMRQEVGRVMVLCAEFLQRYDEAYDAALSRGGRGMVETGGRGWSGFEDKDPTGETAVISWDPQHIRGAARFASKALKRASAEVENANARLHDAFLDTDPDLKVDRLDKRRAALADRDG
jgi:hypothetical protein